MTGSVPRCGWVSYLQSLLLGFWALAAIAALCPLLILPLSWKEQAIFGAVLIPATVVAGLVLAIAVDRIRQ